MVNLSRQVQTRFAHYQQTGLLRERVIADKTQVNFSSNDYLGLAAHVEVIKAFSKNAEYYGLGSGASALLSGYSNAHADLEAAFAAYLKRERALLFNSGYLANLGVLTALANRNSYIVADKYCHASLHDGAVLARARYKRFAHNNMVHAEALLQETVASDTLLVSESVFSMQGDMANVFDLAQLAKQYGALLAIDHAHGVGVIEAPRQTLVPCLVVPLGKALGSMGAIVAGSAALIEALLQFARTYCYSTALPPAVCAATSMVLHIMQVESWRKEKLQDLVRFFIAEAQARNLSLSSITETPIKSILIGNNQAALALKHYLVQRGFLVACIRPPTVPKHAAGIRISLNCQHTQPQITQLLDAIYAYQTMHRARV